MLYSLAFCCRTLNAIFGTHTNIRNVSWKSIYFLFLYSNSHIIDSKVLRKPPLTLRFCYIAYNFYLKNVNVIFLRVKILSLILIDRKSISANAQTLFFECLADVGRVYCSYMLLKPFSLAKLLCINVIHRFKAFCAIYIQHSIFH